MTFVLTLGRVERFKHSRDVAGFLGLRPKQRPERRARTAVGDFQERRSIFAQAVVQCAHHILGHYGKDSALRQWGLTKSEGGKKATLRAVVAVARKLSVLLHRLWVSGEYFKPFPKMA
jgi:transposase